MPKRIVKPASLTGPGDGIRIILEPRNTKIEIPKSSYGASVPKNVVPVRRDSSAFSDLSLHASTGGVTLRTRRLRVFYMSYLSTFEDLLGTPLVSHAALSAICSTVVYSCVAWTLLYFVCRRVFFPRLSADFSNRAVSFVHAVVGAVLAYVSFSAGFWSELGTPSTHKQASVLVRRGHAACCAGDWHCPRVAIE